MVKRGKIALLSLTLMLLIAGYINYKYNPEREKNLGKTIYVNGKDSYMYENVSIYNEEESSISNVEEKSNVTGNSNSNEDAISVFRYDRDNMYSELEENYRSTISNTNTSKEKINDYQDKLNKLIEEKNLISMVENVILSKGIEDIVISPTSNNNLNVVIKSKEEIPSDLMAKIQQIIVDQLSVEASKISIIRQN